MTTISIPIAQLQAFLLIFLRVSAIILVLPIFSSKNIPVMLKAGLSISVSIVLFPMVRIEALPFLTEPIPFAIEVMGEILLGAVIGLSVRMLFAGIQLAGQLLGFQMGLGIANVMDPISNSQASVIAQLKNLFAMLMFLAVNAHHQLLQALVKSFRMMPPPLDFQYGTSLMEQVVRLAGNMFIIAVKVGAPVMIVLLLTSVALGLVARTVPQMNVFIVAFPVKIVIGFVFLAGALPFLASFLKQIFEGMSGEIFLILKNI